MKKFILQLIILFSFGSNGLTQEVAATSRINEVTVYRNLAKESRISTVTIPSGNSDIVISGVSMHMTDQSLQVAVKGDATLLSATVRVNYFKDIPDARKDAKAVKLQDSINAIEKQLRWIAEERSIHLGEITLVNELLKPANRKEGYSAADLDAMAEIYRVRTSDLKKKIFDLSNREESLANHRREFQEELNGMVNIVRNPVKEIVLSFSAEKSGSVQLNCNYLVNNASWAPMYDINVESTTKPVNLTYKAKIRQETGFDWKDVKLMVSTANPSFNNDRPLMAAKYIDYVSYTLTPYSGAVTNMMQAERSDFRVIMPDDISNDPISEMEDEILVEFELDMKQSIPCDGREHVCRMKDYTVPATYRYHAVPKLDASAYLIARITDYGQFNLLAGQANIFYGDTYVGQVGINPQITADTLLLSLGRDERIVVKRVRVQNKTSRSTLGEKQKDNYVWETTIRNNKGTAIEIEILDQVPLSRRKEILVELKDTDKAIYDKDYGKLLWNFKINPNDSKKIRLEYNVEYPKGKQVSEQ